MDTCDLLQDAILRIEMLDSVSLEEERVDSALGTKEYWENHYNNELTNFNENGDEGEVWFGKSAENRMLRYITDNVAKEAAILDLGTGNASVLRNLRLKGYTNLTGVDYCEAAVELSRKAARAEETVGSTKIEFAVADLIANETDPALKGRFQVILDKGTWDAISLAGDRNERLKNYRRSVMDFFEIREDCDDKAALYFIIFSCNFTQAELIDLFEGDDLAFECDIPATTVLVFGGKPGTTSTGAVFKKT
uniref:Protein-lysine N-methyltransferase n=1 Tax=Panagrellus redivivus TaxID=6233 RepID=A0A7E4W6J5_PANRE